MKYHDMVKAAKVHNIPVVDIWKDAPVNDAQKLLKEIYKKKGIEGYVLRFDSGAMYKVKTKFYAM